MRKTVLIFSLVCLLAIIGMLIIRENYKGSPDYNYITAKLDIRNGNIRIVKTGYRVPSSKDKEIDMVAGKYGFKNQYIGHDTTKQKMNGIKNYNKLMEAYLALRNGHNWRAAYQREVDSLYKAAANPEN